MFGEFIADLKPRQLGKSGRHLREYSTLDKPAPLLGWQGARIRSGFAFLRGRTAMQMIRQWLEARRLRQYKQASAESLRLSIGT
jgi:hypothetical protein